jgi:hypothetical protein
VKILILDIVPVSAHLEQVTLFTQTSYHRCDANGPTELQKTHAFVSTAADQILTMTAPISGRPSVKVD